MRLSVVLPTYNEAGTILPLLRRILTVSQVDEILVVDDDSPDRTWEIASQTGSDRVHVLRRTSERGLVSALNHGIRNASGDIVAWMDADGSHPPEMLPQMLSAMANADIAIASRYVAGGSDKRKSALRALSSRFLNWLSRDLLHPTTKDCTTGYVLARKEWLLTHPLQGNYGEYCIRLLVTAERENKRVVEIPFANVDREQGESKTDESLLTFFKLGVRYLRTIFQLWKPGEASSTVEAAGVAFVFALALLVFVNKPVHMDDPVFIGIAKSLLKDPLHPFAAQINWVGVTRSVFYEDNPFFLNYYYALVMLLFGEKEWILHVAYLLFPTVAAVSTYSLAGRRGLNPLLSSALFLSTPALFVSATTLMADVPLIAFYIASCALYYKMQSQPSARTGLLLALSVSIAIFTKYIGLTLIPLIAFDAIRSRNYRKPLGWLLIPLLLFLLWNLQNLASMGALHILEAGKSMNFGAGQVFAKFITSLSFAGLSVVAFAFFPLLRKPVHLITGILFAATGAAIAWHYGWVHQPINAVLMGIGISAALMAIIHVCRVRTADLLVMWFCGMLVYCWLAEYIAARVVLLFACPMILLLAKSLPPRAVTACILLNLALSMVIASADQEDAGVYKKFANELSVGNTTYIGHWGFQYYMERRGVPPFDYDRDHLTPGETLIVPEIGGTSDFYVPRQDGLFQNTMLKRVRIEELSPHRGVFVMNFENDAGFYCDGWGKIPFSFGSAPLERVYYLRAEP